ncbi:IS66 family insertion sequence element accessory protein TnpA [Methylovulum psychrotolerans]|uniref:IS66 family insertion sequence element accessory protein TnpA n=1 Tax=Methylovulum psychrotolerans TaxID=1704499 RepID=UPI002012B479|nr:IS66 family insertion sequence element accessory protein TnpB [Methylovulum psychrotolerans]
MALSKKWIGHIEAWQASGLPQADFCRQQQLNAKTFAARLCEYRRVPPPPAFIPVQVDTAAPTPGTRAATGLSCRRAYRRLGWRSCGDAWADPMPATDLVGGVARRYA